MDRQLSNGAVTTVHYTISASDGTYSSGAYGSVGLDQPEDDSELTPYSELTESWAVAAVQAKLGGADKVAEIEAALQTQIDLQRTPVSGSGVPW
jgi:hypothetical protein|tara:strand:- start:1649 stop:1930 length:282 start_codon:yes stop_codon:yes gene_type:complete